MELVGTLPTVTMSEYSREVDFDLSLKWLCNFLKQAQFGMKRAFDGPIV